MRNCVRRNINSSSNRTEEILYELETLQSKVASQKSNEFMLDYILSMATELSTLAKKCDEKFLGYRLDLAVKEAESATARARYNSIAA